MKTVPVMQTGTVSQATHRTQDLIITFVEFITNFIAQGGEIPNWENVKALCQELGKAEPMGKTLSWTWPDDNDPEWDTEDTSILLNEDLWGILEDIAPEGFYFGAHEGNGSDFGFWVHCMRDDGGSCADCPHLSKDLCPELECDL